MSYQKAKLSQGVTQYEYIKQDGDLLVFLHGGTIPSWCWDKQVEFFKDKGFSILRYDMYGRGGSDAPDGAYDRDFYQSQLLDLLNHLEIKDPITLVGTSFGGATSTNFTKDYPERVKKLILLSPAINWMSHQPLAKILGAPIIGKALFNTIGKKRVTKRALGYMDTLKPEVAKHYRALFLEQVKWQGFWKALYFQLTGDALTDYRDIFKSVASEDFPQEVHLMWGANDEEITREDVNDILKDQSKIKLTAVEGSGHGLMAEEPEKINEFIASCL